MSVPDELRRDAERTGELVRKKLLEIMELQADIDTLLRGDKPTPFGAKRWEYACLEALQRFDPAGDHLRGRRLPSVPLGHAPAPRRGVQRRLRLRQLRVAAPPRWTPDL